MTSINAKRRPLAMGDAPNLDWLRSSINLHNSHRNSRRQYLVRHLHRAGPRPLLEALLEVDAGRGLDQVLERYGRIPVEVYRALRAHVLSIDSVAVIDGDRA